jgi:4-diphosphocytidyl-2-C-methyl-D-erythritol kinase
MPTTVRAHAKVNLALSVGVPIAPGEPNAGLHPIASLMAALDLCDEVTVEPAESDSWLCGWTEDAPRRSVISWTSEQDLAMRALRRLERVTGRGLPARVSVRKRIPAGGGLGGGSSDAAACLRAANLAFELGLSSAELSEIGASIGSDVPFFLDHDPDHDGRDDARAGLPPRPALVTGVGERIERVRFEATPLLLVLPPFGCDTAEVYRAFDDGPLTLDEARVAALAAAGRTDGSGLFNDLTAAARRHEPRVADLMRRLDEALRAFGAPGVHLSGSGSSVFIVTPEPGALGEALRRALPGASYTPARTLTGTEARPQESTT